MRCTDRRSGPLSRCRTPPWAIPPEFLRRIFSAVITLIDFAFVLDILELGKLKVYHDLFPSGCPSSPSRPSASRATWIFIGVVFFPVDMFWSRIPSFLFVLWVDLLRCLRIFLDGLFELLFHVWGHRA